MNSHRPIVLVAVTVVLLLAVVAVANILALNVARETARSALAAQAGSQRQLARLQGEVRGLRELITTLEAEGRKPAKWEYKIASPSDYAFDISMADYGANGWELVSARRASSAGEMSYEMIFKRRKS